MFYNLRKEFLGTSKEYRDGGIFNVDLDEPTYLTFKLEFYSDELDTEHSLYDTLPQALFSLGDQAGNQVITTLTDWSPDLTSVQSFIDSFKGTKLTGDSFISDRQYSALEYLYSRNEDYRCFLLANFIKGWNDLQTRYQFYFQEIDGLDNLFVSRPDKGQKIDKSATITIKCLEAIDQKVKYLFSLYKAAAWDDKYQKWILPEIYRYFKLNIYISEIRVFHQSKYADPITGNAYLKSLFPDLYKSNGSFRKVLDGIAGRVINNVTGKVMDWVDDTTEGAVNENAYIDQFTLNSVYGFLPVTCLHCEMCDFDIDSNPFRGTYNINNDQMEETTVKIRVRQAEEWHNWRYINPYKNLTSATDRTQGQDYLNMFKGIGELSDQYFNNEIDMADSEKKHNYGGRIDSGWIVDSLGNIISKVVSGEDSAPLDIAADIYQGVRNSIAEKKAMKGNFEISKASTDEFPQDMQVRLIGNDPETYSTATIEVNDETYDSLMTALRTDGTIDYIRKHSKEMQEMSDNQKALSDSMINEVESTYNDILQKTQYRSASVDGKDINRVMQDEADRSHSTDLDNNVHIWNNEEKEKMLHVSQPEDRSHSTNLDNDDKWDPYERAKMQGIDNGGDRSGATNLDNLNDWESKQSEGMQSTSVEGNDRSLATDLDGLPITHMTEVVQPDLYTLATTPNEDSIKQIQNTGVEQGNDRSLATNLDNGLRWDEEQRLDLTYTKTEKDRSHATDLDNISKWEKDQKYKMEHIDQGTDRSEATDLDNENIWTHNKQSEMSPVINPNDKSLATDLDNENDDKWTPTQQSRMTHVKQGDDRSNATNLDNTSEWDNENFGEMTSTYVDIDRSLATDLDGKPNDENIIGVGQGEDRSVATNLDNKPTWDHEQSKEMTSTSTDIDKSFATDLDNKDTWNTQERAKMQDVKQVDDRSLATDLDDMPDTTLNPLQEIEQPKDRSLATDLDGLNKPQMVDINQGNDRSLATNLDNTDVFYEDDERKLMTYPNTVEDRSVATNLDNEETWESKTFYELTKVEQPKDRSIATNLDNDIEFEDKSRAQMPTIKQGNDRSLATDLDDKPIKDISELQNVEQSEDRSLATALDNKSSWEKTENDKMPIIENPSDRSYATDLDGLKVPGMTSVSQITDKNNELHAADILERPKSKDNIKLATTTVNIDRSKATDLDGGPLNFENMSLFEKIAAGIKDKPTTIDASPLVDNTEKKEEIQGLFLDDGSINPNASVKDLIDVYIVMNEYKKSTIEDTPLVDNTKQKKTIL